MSDRAEYIKGLRALADLLEAHPDLSLPYHGGSTHELLFITGPDQVTQIEAYIQAMDAPPTIAVEDGTAHYPLRITGRIHGWKVTLAAALDKVGVAKEETTTTWVVPDSLLALGAVAGAR